MIGTGKKDVLVSYLAYFLRLSSNLLLLPVILRMLSSEEYGLWNIYVSLGAIVNLVDIGFGAVLTRYSTYAFCGAECIGVQGMPVMGNSRRTNYMLLFYIFQVAKQIYKKLFLLSEGICILLSGYIYMKALGQIACWEALFSWAVYSFSCSIYIYYVSYNCIIKGMGKVKESNYYYIIQQLIYLGVGYLTLSLGLGLLGLALANLLSTFVFRLLNINFLNKRFFSQRKLQQKVEMRAIELYDGVYKAVKKNTAEIALVTISHYFSQYGITLICSLFLPLSVIGCIGITNQLVGVVATLAGTGFSTYMSKMGEMLINGEKAELRKKFVVITRWFILIYLAGSVFVIGVGPYFLQLLASDTQLLGKWCVILVFLNSIVVNYHQRCTSLIMLGNEQPHVKAYFISSIMVVGVSLISLYIIPSVWGYIIPSFLIQLLYNGWRWPLEIYRRIGLRLGDIVKLRC